MSAPQVPVVALLPGPLPAPHGNGVSPRALASLGSARPRSRPGGSFAPGPARRNGAAADVPSRAAPLWARWHMVECEAAARPNSSVIVNVTACHRLLRGLLPGPLRIGWGIAPVRATSARALVALVQATSVRVLPPCRVLRVAVRLCARAVVRLVAAVRCGPLKGRTLPSPRRASPSRTARGVIVLSSAAGLFWGRVGQYSVRCILA